MFGVFLMGEWGLYYLPKVRYDSLFVKHEIFLALKWSMLEIEREREIERESEREKGTTTVCPFCLLL